MKRFVFLFVVLTLLCIFVGCSANGDSEDTVPFDGVYLSGKILFNGMPLPDTDVSVNGLIVFSTDGDGTFYLGSLEKGDVITFFKDGYSFAPSSVTADGSDSYLIITACLAGYTVNVLSDFPALSTHGTFNVSGSLTLTANENADCAFIGWYDGDTLLSALKSFVFTPTADTEIHARYETRPSDFSCSLDGKIVSWTTSDGALLYELYLNGVLVAATPDLSFDISDFVTDGVLYTIKIVAKNNSFQTETVMSAAFSPLPDGTDEPDTATVDPPEDVAFVTLDGEVFILFYATAEHSSVLASVNGLTAYESDLSSITETDIFDCDSIGKTFFERDGKMQVCIYANVTDMLRVGENLISVSLGVGADYSDAVTLNYFVSAKLSPPSDLNIVDGILSWSSSETDSIFYVYLNSVRIAVVEDGLSLSLSAFMPSEGDVISVVQLKDGYLNSDPAQISVTP